ncbi:MAG: cytochrome c5 family protein [Gammaproteobacteria bacterium]|nr:cytochrome c5 family protein [Gammaproteobacteria bacterium]
MIEEQIEPFGKVAVAGQDAPPVMAPPPVSVQPAVVAVVEEVSGEDVYNGACAVCHTAGIAGSPKTGDVAAWSSRIAKGAETLYANAINGYQGEAGVMPAKGGRADLTDEAVRAAVDYMTAQSQ